VNVHAGDTSLPPIEILARRFAACELSRAEWTHEAHLTVGLWYVARYGADEALKQLRAGIRRLNESNGVANTPDGGYHETITRAYVGLLDTYLVRSGTADDLQSLCELLLDTELARRDVLFSFWSKPLLLSARARAEWVEPDLAPLASGEFRCPIRRP
jgi:hypothetical protein